MNDNQSSAMQIEALRKKYSKYLKAFNDKSSEIQKRQIYQELINDIIGMQHIIKEIDKLFDNKDKIDKMHKASLDLGVRDSSERIFNVILEVVGDKNE